MKTIKALAALAAISISTTSLAAPVNINTANATEIAAALTGIGLSKAEAIIDYRQAYGLFGQPQEIVFVRGIGEATYLNNKDDILVK